MVIILVDSLEVLDRGFLIWTMRRKAATLRISKKINRPKQKCVSIVKSYYIEPPKKIVKVVYTTGIEKFSPKTMQFGEKS